MKKEEMKEMKEIVKEAVLEALMLFTTGGVATASEDDPIVIEPGDGELPTRPEEGEGEDESGKGGGSADNSGGTPNNGRPKPDVGVGVWSMR